MTAAVRVRRTVQPPFLRLFKSRRAISAVVSNVILLGAVIVVGFAVIAWSQSLSSSYSTQYGQAVSANINQTTERIVFEYIFYDNGKNNLTVYIMNSGTIGNVSIKTVYVNGGPNSTITLKLLNGTSVNSLNAGQEGDFSIFPSPSLTSGKSNLIDVITGRGSSFVSTFAT